MLSKPKKTISLILLFITLCLLLCGCWNYRQLNEISIVMGMAIDKDSNDNYILTFEIMDLSKPSTNSGTKSLFIESSGKTIFEAFRNSKAKVADKLYIGNMEILIISNKIAAEDGILSILDLFLRDGEPRETLKIAISQEKTAKEILQTKGISNGIASMDLKEIIETNQKTISSSIDIEIYKVYSHIKSEGLSLVLPAIHCVKNTDTGIESQEKIAEVNGVAVFKDDKLVGYLSPEETFYYLFIVDKIKGGVLTLGLNGCPKPNISFEISRSNTKRTHINERNKIKIKLKITTYVYINELTTDSDISTPEGIKKIQAEAEKALAKDIKNTVKSVQLRFNSDIFGFGNIIYKKDYKLWQKINQNWDDMFGEIEIETETKIHVKNTSFIKNSQ
jgi:spore germination protein KC